VTIVTKEAIGYQGCLHCSEWSSGLTQKLLLQNSKQQRRLIKLNIT